MPLHYCWREDLCRFVCERIRQGTEDVLPFLIDCYNRTGEPETFLNIVHWLLPSPTSYPTEAVITRTKVQEKLNALFEVERLISAFFGSYLRQPSAFRSERDASQEMTTFIRLLTLRPGERG